MAKTRLDPLVFEALKMREQNDEGSFQRLRSQLRRRHGEQRTKRMLAQASAQTRKESNGSP